ncbi:hypothetical protein GCM10010168_19340 [Actinoplanes ianthinogenes]|uniref:Cell wall synthesis protein Wag31 n=2 Tax=Actinoplanes ianthinogenes TaxID=122358 RepID=A0ABN6CQT0_9ACTN|nr:hypothetical protein Aiant_82330 [Actinoplanes ianthinogenes]GGR02715.1 hypothetical protein GCM10010168_19340 [Actinoplanes ianthinogenes]
MAFRRPPLGKRGYDETQVDDFLDAIQQTFTELAMQNKSLRRQLRYASGTLEPRLAALTRRLRSLESEHAAAEQHARHLRIELDRARAELVPHPAAEAAGMAAMARRTADEHLRDAERAAEELMTAARAEADRLTSEAAIKASTIDSDARHRHREAMNSLAALRAATLEDIDRLEAAAATLKKKLYDQVSQRLLGLLQPPGPARS